MAVTQISTEEKTKPLSPSLRPLLHKRVFRLSTKNKLSYDCVVKKAKKEQQIRNRTTASISRWGLFGCISCCHTRNRNATENLCHDSRICSNIAVREGFTMPSKWGRSSEMGRHECRVVIIASLTNILPLKTPLNGFAVCKNSQKSRGRCPSKTHESLADTAA